MRFNAHFSKETVPRKMSTALTNCPIKNSFRSFTLQNEGKHIVQKLYLLFSATNPS